MCHIGQEALEPDVLGHQGRHWNKQSSFAIFFSFGQNIDFSIAKYSFISLECQSHPIYSSQYNCNWNDTPEKEKHQL